MSPSKTVQRSAWYKSTLRSSALGQSIQLEVPHDVFSTMRIDEGTSLLLDHLPQSLPGTLLDMGCGYGALGLPIASKYPECAVEMVDRDLLAVAWTKRNAELNRLTNVTAYGSLGYRDLKCPERRYDWILCNVPARIGNPFIEHLLDDGLTRLAPGGELRIVVIKDLGPIIEAISNQNQWKPKRVADGARHFIYSFDSTFPHSKKDLQQDNLYFRDTIRFLDLEFKRPFDLGGDDPKRVNLGLPVLIDALPKQAPFKILCFRSGYGVLPLICRSRWPKSEVTVIERDLLAFDYICKNADALSMGGALLRLIKSEHFPETLSPDDRFDLVLGELSPSAGEAVAASELVASSRFLKPGGQALILSIDKLVRDWVYPIASRECLNIHPLISRDGHSVLMVAPSLNLKSHKQQS